MRLLIALAALLLGPALAAKAPHLAKRGEATQLIVDGKPFLIRGGELGNSTASSREDMATVWPKLAAMKLNTVLAPVTWEAIEPVEGAFDFSSVDGLVADARAHDIRLVLLCGSGAGRIRPRATPRPGSSATPGVSSGPPVRMAARRKSSPHSPNPCAMPMPAPSRR